MTAQTQDQLLEELTTIFPDFKAYWLDGQEDGDFPNTSLHSVYQDLITFLGDGITPKQWQSLAELINDAVAFGGDPENAVATCLLEHLGQAGLTKHLRPLLTPAARSRLHA
jgi:hypothetical protein